MFEKQWNQLILFQFNWKNVLFLNFLYHMSSENELESALTLHLHC